MRDDALVVGGLVVPEVLTRLIRSGRWQAPPAESPVYRAVFGDEADLPSFYGEAKILRENASWQRLTVDEVFGDPAAGGPGVDPARSVVIADLGPDLPVVLDHRLTADDPRVLYLGPHGWTVIAPNAAALIAQLPIAPPPPP
ncbi:hypothetical protein FH609_030055 [Streptomyces sp. 3MP-14]|uniref:Uncharacterized protein n=1 Tax=Streptomyces mimosae TaxID=2586635 RepID=A0A5N5ZMC1_9ACTN|nr:MULTISPECIES: hypothetical protein [Streptomyces]KAB8157052.1 hypothetical protein FH607_030640 [Streptomyces mimosae]KAB8172500.1 hypothetical protein FH609_030055 [Streptomyces sp. 3MP-14]